MADLPDYYTQTSIAEAEAASFDGGLDANKSAAPVSRDIYLATDTHILYVCFADGTWTGFDAATLTQGILTLYENMVANSKKITSLADPTAAQDAATRAYVLNRVALRLALTGGTMSGNIIMGGNKVTGLGAPLQQDQALRYNRAEIRNAEIAAAAAIVYSKLNLTGLVRNADIKSDAAIVESKLSLDQGTQALYDKIATDIATHTALKTGIHGIVVVRKTADEAVNNSTTLQNDDHLLFAIGASEIWDVLLILLMTWVSANPDIKFNWALPSGGVNYTLIPYHQTWLADTDAYFPGVSSTQMGIIHALLINSSTAGNAQLQWAQLYTAGEDVKVLTNSFLVARRLL